MTAPIPNATKGHPRNAEQYAKWQAELRAARRRRSKVDDWTSNTVQTSLFGGRAE